jgi:hypothetical protein
MGSMMGMSTFAVNTIVTNMRGPDFALYQCGAQMLVARPIVPLNGGLGVVIGVLSYNNTISFGLSGDPAIMEDLGEFREMLEKSFHALVKAAGASKQKQAKKAAPKTPAARKKPATRKAAPKKAAAKKKPTTRKAAPKKAAAKKKPAARKAAPKKAAAKKKPAARKAVPRKAVPLKKKPAAKKKAAKTRKKSSQARILH